MCTHTQTHPHIERGQEEFKVNSIQPLAFQTFNYSFKFLYSFKYLKSYNKNNIIENFKYQKTCQGLFPNLNLLEIIAALLCTANLIFGVWGGTPWNQISPHALVKVKYILRLQVGL